MNSAPIDPTKTHQTAEFKHEKALTTCRFDPSGRFVFAGAEDLNVYRWDIQSKAKTTLAGHESWVRSLDFSADGKTLFTAGWDGKVGWWPAADDKPRAARMIDAHRGFARWVRVSPGGRMLATCGNDKLIRVWDAASGGRIGEFSGHRRHVYAVDFHPDDGCLASEDLLGNVFAWDLEKVERIAAIEARVMTGYDNKFAADMGGARDMRFSADGKTLACAGITNVVNAFAGQQDPIVVLIDWATKSITHHLRQVKTTAGIMWGVRFHAAGFLIGAVAMQNGRGELAFWRPGSVNAKTQDKNTKETKPDGGPDSTSGKPENPKPIELKPFHTTALTKCARAVDISPDGRRLAVAHSDGCLRLYDMTEKQDEKKPAAGKHGKPKK